MGDAKRDDNYVTTLLAVSNADGSTPVTLYADPTTHRLLVNSTASVTPAGNDTEVQFNDGGSLGADSGFTYNKTTDTATLAGNLQCEDLLIEDSDASHYLTITTTSNLTATRTLTLVPGDANRTLTISGDSTVDQDVSSTASPTFVGLTLSGAVATATTIAMGGDLTNYEATNDGNPEIRLGSADAEELHIQAVYDGGAQTLDYVIFQTDVASATADKGEFRFNVDGTLVATFDDGGLEIKASGSLSFGAVDILTDSAGTTTLNNIDALDATTATTIATGADAATTSATGVVELATTAETDTGTDTGRAVTPDGLAGSIYGTKPVQVIVVDFTTDVATGDGKAYFHIPASMNGMNLTTVHAEVITAGTTGTTDIQIHNVTQAADMLSTVITIDSAETGSDTAVTPAVIDTANDDIATNDLIRIDVDAVSTTAPKGLLVTMEFMTP